MVKCSWFFPAGKNDHEASDTHYMEPLSWVSAIHHDPTAPPEDNDGDLEDGEPRMTEEEELERALQLSMEEEEAKWVGLRDREAIEVSQAAAAEPPHPPQEGDETLPPPPPTAGVWPPSQVLIVIDDEEEQ
jgi:hypothetical protein